MASSLDTVEVPVRRDSNTDPANKDANTADVQSAIVRQVEFYFSDANLPTDKFLLKQVQQQGQVPVKLIAQFKRVKSLTKDVDLITEALKGSSELVVSADNMFVRRVKPLPNVNEHDIKRRTAIVTHLPGVPSIESVTDLFSQYGPVKLVRICPPGSTEKLPQWLTVANPCVQAAAASNQLFALVEFASEEAVGRAVADSTGTSDGQNGIQVRHLMFAGQHHRAQQQQQQQMRGTTNNTNARGRGQGGHGRGAYQGGPAAPGASVDQLRHDVAGMHLHTAPNGPAPYSNQRDPDQQQPRSAAANPARGGAMSQDHRRATNTTQRQQAPYTTHDLRVRGPHTIEAVPYVPSHTLDNGQGTRGRPSSTTPTPQRILLVRPRADAPAGSANGGYEQRGGEQSGGRVRDRPASDRTAPDRQAAERPVSVGRRAPHFVVDLDYQPTESGRRAVSRRQRGGRGALETTFEAGAQNIPVAGGSGQGGAQLAADKKQQQQQQQQQRAKSGRQGGPVPAQNGRQGGAAPHQQQQQHGGLANQLFTSPMPAGRGGPLQEAASSMQGLQGQVGGGEKDLSQFIALFQSFVQHQLGTPEPAQRPAGASAPMTPPWAADRLAPAPAASGPGSNGLTSASTPTATPAKSAKKAKNKGARADSVASTPEHSKAGTPPRDGLFVFGGEGGAAQPDAAAAAFNTPVQKVASHGKKGKGSATGGSSQKKKDGVGGQQGGTPVEGAATGGADGNPGNPPEGAFIPKKRTKKDYAAWAAATSEYRTQSSAAYGNGEGPAGGAAGGGGGTPPQGHGPYIKEPSAGTPKVPDGTKGFGMGRGRPLPPPAP